MAKKAKKEDKAPVKGAKVSNGLAAKVRGLDEKIERMQANWRKFVEIHVGGDSKIGSIRAALMGIIAIGCIAGIACAGLIEKWDESGGTASVTESGGSITIAADVMTPTTLSGATTISGTTVAATTGNITTVNATTVAATTVGATDVNISSVITCDATSLSVTNGQAVTLAKSVYNINGINGADDTTNTITLANVSPAMVGAQITLVINSASSNLIAIADSAPAYLSAAFEGDNNDTLELYVVATNILVETSVTDN